MDTLLGLASHLRRRLADALESGSVSPPYSASNLRAVLGMTGGAEDVADALRKLDDMGLAARPLAAWVSTLETGLARAPKPDLVWSGPELAGLEARDTRQVYEELMGTAERSVWASTYAFFDGAHAFQTLARRMEEKPALWVTLLLNIQRGKGDTSTADSLVRRFADHFWTTDWPGSTRPKVFYDPRALDPEGPSGVLHAKAVVVDETRVFVTSANLTEAALDRNIEMGLLVRDRALALSISTHFQSLIDHGFLHALPIS